MPRDIYRVALIYDATMTYDLRVMEGVAAFLQANTQWSVYIEENALKDQRLPDLTAWQGNGIIANLDHAKVAAEVSRSKLPVVGFGSGYGWYAPKSQVPYFFTDNEAIAGLAADHLLLRGFRNFAFCGYPRTPTNGWAEEREIAFRRRVAERGFACPTFKSPRSKSRNWNKLEKKLIQWVLSLQKPVGLFAANDSRARQLLEACRECGLRVPEEVAVIGVDNDEVLCQLSSPLLTSIEQGARRIGFEAAMLLHKMMLGEPASNSRNVIAPEGVVMRSSTNVMSIQDPQVAKAISFIQVSACDGIKVKDVVEAVAVSRSGLELRFKTALSHTIHEAIQNAKLQQARILFTESNFAAKDIAARTGFRSVQHLSTLFKAAFGAPPVAYRRRYQLLNNPLFNTNASNATLRP